MSTFSIVSFAAAIFTFVLLVGSIYKRRCLMVKPTIWVIGYFHLQIQWAAAITSAKIEAEMLYPWHFFVLCHIVPITALLISLGTFRRTSEQIWARLRGPTARNPVLSSPETLLLMLAWFFVLALYFSVVPIGQTGLWITLTSRDYLTSVLAREDSLKLISNPFVKYFYAYNANFLALFFGFFAALRAFYSIKARKFAGVLFWSLLFMALVISSGLSGARSPAAVIIMGTFLGFWIRSGAPLNPVRLSLAAFLVLAIPSLVTLFRSGDAITFENFTGQFQETVLARAFYVPMETGMVHCKYVQENGYWGLAGTGKIATLFGVEYINTANHLANVIFGNSVVNTGLVSTSYVFIYYSNFGLTIVPLIIILLVAIDFILLFYRTFSDKYLLPGLTAINTGCICLIGSDYTTLFLTYGYVPGVLTVLGLMILFEPKVRNRMATFQFWTRPSLAETSLTEPPGEPASS